MNIKFNFFKPEKKTNIDIEPSAPPAYEYFLLIQMNSNQSFCLGGRHYSETVCRNVYEKKYPKTKKNSKFIKRKCDICGRNKSQVFSK